MALGFQAAGAAADAVERHVPRLVADRVASRLADADPTLWGEEARPEASIRLGWVDAARSSRPLVQDILDLRDDLRAEGVDRIVLAGMGGSSLAPEVITRTAGVELVVLDSTDPEMVGNALADRIATSAIVVSSKSGSTVETDSLRRVFEQAFTDAGLEAARRIVVVTDPGSPMDRDSRAAGYRAVFNADPNVGGRYSALTAFGLVPAGLAGADIEQLLDDAEETADFLGEDDEDNIALALGAAIAGTEPLRDKLVIVDEGSGIVGFADWAEQLVAESTGKQGVGLLPVVAAAGAPEAVAPDRDVLLVRLVASMDAADRDDADGDDGGAGDDDGGAGAGDRPGGRGAPADGVWVSGSLGSQLLLWEYATAVAGRVLGINPFDQPDVEAAKNAARGLLEATPAPEPAQLVDGGIELRADGTLLGDCSSLVDALRTLLVRVGPANYLSVQAYLDRLGHPRLEDLRDALAATTGRPVTFGWGPRFLHSTGQYHKGGPRTGVFLQITADSDADLEIPGRPFTFGQLIAAQAAGDAQVLADHDLPVLRLHLRDRGPAVEQLLRAVAAVGDPTNG